MEIISQNMAMMPVESMLENLFFWVELVQNGVGIWVVAGRKNDDLVFLAHFPEEGEGIWADIDSDLDWHIIDFDLDFEVGLNFQVFNAMN